MMTSLKRGRGWVGLSSAQIPDCTCLYMHRAVAPAQVPLVLRYTSPDSRSIWPRSSRTLRIHPVAVHRARPPPRSRVRGAGQSTAGSQRGMRGRGSAVARASHPTGPTPTRCERKKAKCWVGRMLRAPGAGSTGGVKRGEACSSVAG
jgi:hypothetical protein